MTSLYDFSELGISTRGQPTGDASNMPEEMFTISDHGTKLYLNQQIPGFHTLSTEGRELLPYKVNTEHIDGYNGNILKTADYEYRQIKVNYLMVTDQDDPKDYRKKFAMLEHFIGVGMMQFGFYDDPDYVYEGVLSSVSQPTPGLSTAVSSFTLTCPEPFKKAISPTTVTFVNTQNFVQNEPNTTGDTATSILATTPVEKIELKPSNDHVKIRSSNGTTISLSGVAHKQVEIRPQDSPANIKVDGKSKPSSLDLMSGLENFAIEPGGKITCDDGGNVSITYRKRGA